MDNELQKLEIKKKEIFEQIQVLENDKNQKFKKYRSMRDSLDEESFLRLHDEITQIHNEIYKLYDMVEKIDDEIDFFIPPVKMGKLVDLRIDDSSRFSIYLHNQPIKVGNIEYRDYHWSEYLGDIGYTIKEEYRNHGYATEALALLSEKLYEEGVTDFWICVSVYNIGSIKVVEKNGGNLLKSERDICLYVVPTKTRNLNKISQQRIS